MVIDIAWYHRFWFWCGWDPICQLGHNMFVIAAPGLKLILFSTVFLWGLVLKPPQILLYTVNFFFLPEIHVYDNMQIFSSVNRCKCLQYVQQFWRRRLLAAHQSAAAKYIRDQYYVVHCMFLAITVTIISWIWYWFYYIGHHCWRHDYLHR